MPQLHSSALPQKPLAVASYGMGTAPSPQTHPGSQIDPPANGKQVPSEATTVVAQPRPGRTGPLILRGPSRPQQDRPATVVHPGKEAGNSSLVVIGSRHPAPAAGFSHSTPQPVHLPSAQAPSQPFGMPSDKIGGLAENEPSARFHQAFSLPKPSVNATPSAPQQSAPWWIARPSSSSPNRVEPTFSPAQPVVADHVSHPAAVHHSPAASQPSAPASHAESHAAPSAPAASHHSQSSATKGSR